jgi:P-type conjugative transfer protein TrbL
MPPDFFQQVVAPFTAAAGGWIPQILALGTPIFWMVATLELCTAFAAMVINHDAMNIIQDVTMALLGIAIAYIIFNNAATWGFDLITTFGMLGNEVGGSVAGSGTPDRIMAQGFILANELWTAVGIGTGLMMPLTTIVVMFVAVAVFVIYAWIAVKLTMLLIETFVAVILGSMFLPFGAFYFTKRLVGAWLDWMLGVGVQIFMTYVILALSVQLITNWEILMLGSFSLITSSWTQAFVVLAQALVFWMVLIQVPKQARAVVSGVATPFGFAQNLTGVAGVAGAMFGGAAAAVAAAETVLEPGFFTGATQANLNKMLRNT